jgi:hypothetical protein
MALPVENALFAAYQRNKSGKYILSISYADMLSMYLSAYRDPWRFCIFDRIGKLCRVYFFAETVFTKNLLRQKCLKSDPSVYSGQWEHDRKNGQGTLTKDGTVLRGTWVRNMHGAFVRSADGVEMTEQWEEGLEL